MYVNTKFLYGIQNNVQLEEEKNTILGLKSQAEKDKQELRDSLLKTEREKMDVETANTGID